MIDYSVVKQYPEILYTIDSFVRKNFGEHSCLGNKWSELVTGFDMISFYVNLNDITYINGYSEEWREVLPYEEFYKGIYPYTDSYPKLLYMNLWLLNIGMECLRGELYCARMISEQHGTVFTGDHYEKIQKVYSIWICPSTPDCRKNGMFRYHTIEEPVFGDAYVKKEDYDLMEVVIPNLGEPDNEADCGI